MANTGYSKSIQKMFQTSNATGNT